MFFVAAAVFLLVLAFLAVAVARRHATAEASLTRGVTIAVGVTVVVLFVLLGATMWTQRGVASSSHSTTSATACSPRTWLSTSC